MAYSRTRFDDPPPRRSLDRAMRLISARGATVVDAGNDTTGFF